MPARKGIEPGALRAVEKLLMSGGFRAVSPRQMGPSGQGGLQRRVAGGLWPSTVPHKNSTNTHAKEKNKHLATNNAHKTNTNKKQQTTTPDTNVYVFQFVVIWTMIPTAPILTLSGWAGDCDGEIFCARR